MNKHARQHSQKLNIKTTQLASLTAVFRRKKRVPRAVEETPTSAMDVDDTVHPPEHDGQAGCLETITQEPTFLSDDNETDNDGGGDSDRNGGSEEGFTNSDSEDEFESDEEGVGCRGDGPRVNQGSLEFELRAAEAGNILC